MKTLKIGIASYEQMKAMTLEIASGKRKPRKDEPKVWFTSLESIAKVLSARNQELLALIARQKPRSLTELEGLSGRAKSNLSRTLKTMQRYGLVEFAEGGQGRLAPRVLYDRIEFDIRVIAKPGEERKDAA